MRVAVRLAFGRITDDKIDLYTIELRAAFDLGKRAGAAVYAETVPALERFINAMQLAVLHGGPAGLPRHDGRDQTDAAAARGRTRRQNLRKFPGLTWLGANTNRVRLRAF